MGWRDCFTIGLAHLVPEFPNPDERAAAASAGRAHAGGAHGAIAELEVAPFELARLQEAAARAANEDATRGRHDERLAVGRTGGAGRGRLIERRDGGGGAREIGREEERL